MSDSERAVTSRSRWRDQRLDPEAVLLTDRVAIVTGAAQGIGRATAVALARFGADVAVCDRNEEGLGDTATQIEEAGRRAVVGVLDVRDDEAVGAFCGQVRDSWPRVDVLVNNAGGTFWSPFLDVSTKGERALIDNNFTSVTNFIRRTVPLMSDGGSIVNVTSIEAHRAGPGFAVYSAMKAAIANLSKSLALELSDRGIRVNCIAPDVIPVPGTESLAAAAEPFRAGVESQPWPAEGHVDDCAAAVIFLAGDLSRFVTGSTIHVDGGNWAAGGWTRRSTGGYTL